MSREQFHDVVISVRHNLIEIAKSLSSEIRERFLRDELFEAMYIVYPQYWNHSQCSDTLKVDFIDKCKILQIHFYREAEIQGEHIQGILDREKMIDQDEYNVGLMIDQAECFATKMWVS